MCEFLIHLIYLLGDQLVLQFPVELVLRDLLIIMDGSTGSLTEGLSFLLHIPNAID